MQTQLEHDVLIVGGGPTGATLGLLLARAGISTLIVEKEPDIYPLPRAAHIDHEIVRVFQELGLAEELSATWRSSARYDFENGSGDVLMRFEGMNETGSGGWPIANMIHQPSIEAALRNAISLQGNVELISNYTYLSHQTSDDSIIAEVDTPKDKITVRAKYLVGADGARSPVRNSLGIEFDDLGFDEPWLVIDAIVHDETRLPKVNLQICDPDRPTTCVLMGRGRHRWEVMIMPDEEPEDVLDNSFIMDLLSPWDVADAVTIERKAVYRFNAKIALQWFKERTLLAGDAAHQMPPFAGQGLCSGVRDAANLAWKLSAVIQGAPELLLHQYQPEREANVRAIISMAILMGKTVCTTDPVAAKDRDTAMLAAREAGNSLEGHFPSQPIGEGCILQDSPGAGEYFPQPTCEKDNSVRLDDFLGPGAWLIIREESKEQTSAHANLIKIGLDNRAMAPFRALIENWLTTWEANSVLVRPDRYVFGTGDPATLVREWQLHVSSR